MSRAACDLCDLAAGYSLGALDARDQGRFETHLLQGCRACGAELAAMDRVTTLLAEAVEPVAPAASVRTTLMASIGPGEAEDGLTALARAGRWEPHAVPGLVMRVLNVESATREVLMLVRARPGAVYPAHRHAGREELVMLEGRLNIGGRVCSAGDYLSMPAGSIHETSDTPGGCMFLIRTSLDDELLPASMPPERSRTDDERRDLRD